MDIDRLLISAISFGRNAIGLVLRPYETMRRIVDRGSLYELPFIALLLAVYFALASLVKTAAFRPYLLTRQFVHLGGATAITFMLVITLLWVVGRLVGGRGSKRGVVLAWAYTLLPTTAWFFITSLLYVIIPPPRTTSPQGVAFSLLYLVFSATLLYWKLSLGYLTLRFGLKLDLPRIVVVLAIVVPLMGLYSIGMYMLGIFKVPFL